MQGVNFVVSVFASIHESPTSITKADLPTILKAAESIHGGFQTNEYEFEQWTFEHLTEFLKKFNESANEASILDEPVNFRKLIIGFYYVY